ncbi:MAG TPA: VOC family protein [Gaiellaceae bacterium]|nr:VOC family protein [Gaiellaceae bacterium]
MIPSIRVQDVQRSLDFYEGKLGFTVARGTAADGNVALTRRDERVMLEAAGDFYSSAYNDAIRARLGAPSPHAFYLEEPDLEAYYETLQKAGVEIVDPLADRPWGQVEFTAADADGNWLTFWRRS